MMFINGCGRFGLHLIRQLALDPNLVGQFGEVVFGDPCLSFEQIKNNWESDHFLSAETHIRFTNRNTIFVNSSIEFQFSAENPYQADSPYSTVLECSGSLTEDQCQEILNNDPDKRILISQTAPWADQTLVYGYNHDQLKSTSRMISYGSCTVNLFLPMFDLINEIVAVIDCDISFSHNTPFYKISKESSAYWRACTLQDSGIQLDARLTPENFHVSYVMCPFACVSTWNARFQIANLSPALVTKIREQLIRSEFFRHAPIDSHSNEFKFTDYSAVIVDDFNCRGDNLYLYGFFDNENSVNRYVDLMRYLKEREWFNE